MYLPATTQKVDKAPNSPNVGKEPSCVHRDILPVVGSLINYALDHIFECYFAPNK